jgi:pyroglutamyl-peptidase
MSKTVLLTGFDAFPGVPLNPSGEIVKRIAVDAAYDHVHAEVLPTVFTEAGERLTDRIKRLNPRYVMMVGVAAGRDKINLERFALNINDAPKPDNAGNLASGTPIDPDGPLAYASTLPLDRLYKALDAADIPVIYSNHAGAYVCNHVFYVARRIIEKAALAAHAGFIHIPMMSDDPNMPFAENGLPLDTMTDAIKVCLDALV